MLVTESIENPIKQVLRLGQSIWYDGLISPDEFKRMIDDDGLRGATTNPAIFEKALSGTAYDADIQRLSKNCAAEVIYQKLAIRAVSEIAEVFLPVFRQTEGQDGYVSMEVSPRLAHDEAGTVREARELSRLVGYPNLMIKVPATKAGIAAVETLIFEGIPVNATLIFSQEQYRGVREAYLGGLEKRLTNHKPVNGAASVASFFVSRVDTVVDQLIEAKIALCPEDKELLMRLRGRAAIANSKAAYRDFEQMAAGERFRALKNQGARPQRPLWASTGTKNADYRDVVYVESLIGPETVNTVPPATLAAFRDHGVAADGLKEGVAEADKVLQALERYGIDLDKITDELQTAGVKLFCDSYDNILKAIEEKMR